MAMASRHSSYPLDWTIYTVVHFSHSHISTGTRYQNKCRLVSITSFLVQLTYKCPTVEGHVATRKLARRYKYSLIVDTQSSESSINQYSTSTHNHHVS